MNASDPAIISADADQSSSVRAPLARIPNGLAGGMVPGEATPASELPEVLCKRYRIERLLGVGGMGAVYRARDLLREQYGDPEPYIAIKTLNEEFAEYPDANALLYTEFALTSRLRHSNVIRVYAFDIDPQSQRAFITMEPLKGPTLDQLLESHPDGLHWEQYRSIALPLIDALACAHERGVLHGDLKPSNVMLAREGLRLFDFGLGQPVHGLLNGLPKLSRKRIAAWTPRYAALELLNGENLSSSSDVYGLACVLYELISGLHPYSRLTAKQAKSMQQDRSLPKPANLPSHCWPALRQALAFDKEDRLIDARGLFDAFSQPAPSLMQRLLLR